jgi:threonine dehydrogenase-like Zn-dependent dehydrogenase
MLALVKETAGPGMGLRDIDLPEPGPGEVRLAVEAAGICGTDLHIVDWTGGYESMTAHMPVVLGHEFSARILRGPDGLQGARVIVRPSVTCAEPCELCGSDAETRCTRRLGIGIHRHGAFAGEVNAPIRNLLPVPTTMPAHHAALAEPMTVAHEAARNAAIIPGDRVLILGPGPIGLGAALFAREAGAAAVLVGRHDAFRLELARSIGIEHALDVGEGSLTDLLVRHGQARPFQSIIEAVGSPALVTTALDWLDQRGRLVIAGIHAASISLNLTRLVRAHQSLVGSYRAPPSTWPAVIAWLCAHPAIAEALVSERLPLEAIAEGFERMRQRKALKIIIEPGRADHDSHRIAALRQ